MRNKVLSFITKNAPRIITVAASLTLVCGMGAVAITADGSSGAFGDMPWAQNLKQGDQAYETTAYQVAIQDDADNRAHDEESVSDEEVDGNAQLPEDQVQEGALASSTQLSDSSSLVGEGTSIVESDDPNIPEVNQPARPSGQPDTPIVPDTPVNPTPDPGEDSPQPSNPTIPPPSISAEEEQELNTVKEDYVDAQGNRLLELCVEAPTPWEFWPGEAFNPDSVKVKARFEKPDGSTFEQPLSLGEGGYSISINTNHTIGSYNAVFSYQDTSFAVPYSMKEGSLLVRYGAHFIDQKGVLKYYSAVFPGPTGVWDKDTTSKLKSKATVYADPTGIGDLSQMHHTMIAFLGSDFSAGDSTLKEILNTASSGNYKYVPFLETDENGNLTSMITGFRRTQSQKFVDSESRIYYPMQELNGQSTTIISVMESVPAGMRIIREVTGEGPEATGHQTFKAYTGAESELIIPMGTTKIAFDTESSSVETLVIPESVSEIDAKSLALYLPNLKEIKVADTSRSFSVRNNMLMNKDEASLVFCLQMSPLPKLSDWPSTIQEIGTCAFYRYSLDAGEALEIPDSVKTVGKGAFAQLNAASGSAYLRLRGEEPPTGFADSGLDELKGVSVIVDGSPYDVICKNWTIATASKTSIGAAESSGQAAVAPGTYLYKESASGPIAVYADDSGQPTNTLAAIDPNAVGHFKVPDGIGTLGSGALANATAVKEITLPASVAQLEEGALAGLPASLKTLHLSGPCLSVDPHLFGTGQAAPSLEVLVPTKDYVSTLEAWRTALDGTYGDGTAERILEPTDKTYWYDGSAKYLVLSGKPGESGATYHLEEVYEKGQTHFQVAEGTQSIGYHAFSACSQLEIVALPASTKDIDQSAFEGLSSLESLLVGSQVSQLPNVGNAQILQPSGSTSYSYDQASGAIYSSSDRDRTFTLVNAPTSITELSIRANTIALGAEALRGCSSLESTGKLSFETPDKLKKIGASCFEGCTALESASFESVTSLDARAFANCPALYSVSLKSATAFGEGAFRDCSTLYMISAPKLITIANDCFNGCSSLRTFPGKSTVKTIGDRAFAHCKAIGSRFEYAIVESIGEQALMGCSSISVVTLPKTLSSMGEEAFRDCTYLVILSLNSNLTSISRYAFSGCSNLVDVHISEQQRSRLVMLGAGAFSQCTSIENLDLTECAYLRAMGPNTFEECSTLTAIRFPETLESIPSNCFDGCAWLSVVELNGTKPPAVSSSAFGATPSSYLHVLVPGSEMLASCLAAFPGSLDPSYGEGFAKTILGITDPNFEQLRGISYVRNTEGEGWIISDVSEQTSGDVTIPMRVTHINDEAFKGCNLITSITMEGDGTDSYPGGDYMSLGDRCFEGCSSLKEVIIDCSVPAWGDETFEGCTALASVTIGHDENSLIPRIGTRAFAGCTGLSGSAVELKGSINVIGKEAFRGCSNLGRAKPVNTIWYSALTEIEEGAFRDCAALNATYLTNSVNGLKRVGDYAFANCDSLSNNSMPASVEQIGVGCFMDSDNLQTVSFYGAVEEYPKDCFKNCPKLIKTGGMPAAFDGLKRIGESAYEGCSSLSQSEKWHLEKYANLEYIGANAFKGCANMHTVTENNVTYKVTMPAKVTSVGNGALDGWSSIDELVFKSPTPPAFGTIDFLTINQDLVISVPAGSEEAYLAALAPIIGEEAARKALKLDEQQPAEATENTPGESDGTNTESAANSANDEAAADSNEADGEASGKDGDSSTSASAEGASADDGATPPTASEPKAAANQESPASASNESGERPSSDSTQDALANTEAARQRETEDS